MVKTVKSPPSMAKGRSQRNLQVLKAVKKVFAKFCLRCPIFATAKVKKSAEKIGNPNQLSADEFACFDRAKTAFLNTQQLTILAPLFPPAASYRIVAHAIEITQRSGMEGAFYEYIAKHIAAASFTRKGSRLLTVRVVDIVAATLSIAAKLEGAFLWPHKGNRNDVPWSAWVELLGCNLEAAKLLEWAMMHAFYQSSSEADLSTMSSIWGPEFDSEFWAQYKEPREID